MDIIDQVVLRYDREARGFRPVASTLPADDRTAATSRFVALTNASYRTQDLTAGRSLCFARVPDDQDGRSMIICRAPETSSGSVAAAAHVLIGRQLTAQIALALSTSWSRWMLTAGGSGALAPLGWTELEGDVKARNLQVQADSRAPELEAELTRLVDALLRVGSGRLAVIGYRSDPALLLAGAREILGDFGSDDWTFSTGEPAQKRGVRLTFMLRGGNVTSDSYADLGGYDAGSPRLISAAVLVRAFMNSAALRTWAAERAELGIHDLDTLLDWAGRGAPSPRSPEFASRSREQITQQWLAAQRGWDSERQTWDAERRALNDELLRTQRELQNQDVQMKMKTANVVALQEQLAAVNAKVDELSNELDITRSVRGALERHLITRDQRTTASTAEFGSTPAPGAGGSEADAR
ncbi:hypothetical protein FRACA_830002 [Frankia canadensis]|uniref:Uncharacterized protein n=1 Tax=Frankia canadensis TaxID=1836972 RepID=A0A2I2L1Q8_9ACTN|nr:hypothetical protein [Frankia canadensis]SNQ51839.1 hypothetical protein FRACA_830002 [Frankia canadensis]SOU59129.1 hypothetical protein FRACA_830002 [Frankia canadensis]